MDWIGRGADFLAAKKLVSKLRPIDPCPDRRSRGPARGGVGRAMAAFAAGGSSTLRFVSHRSTSRNGG
jgi:hypothetical protein